MITTVDKPSNAVEWGLSEMINQPELLQKATEELDNVVGKERLVQESDIPMWSATPLWTSSFPVSPLKFKP